MKILNIGPIKRIVMTSSPRDMEMHDNRVCSMPFSTELVEHEEPERDRCSAPRYSKITMLFSQLYICILTMKKH